VDERIAATSRPGAEEIGKRMPSWGSARGRYIYRRGKRAECMMQHDEYGRKIRDGIVSHPNGRKHCKSSNFTAGQTWVTTSLKRSLGAVLIFIQAMEREQLYG